LAARVIANRIWQHHFGEGLVGTPNDFGAQGDRPSHPELLEYLAQELVRGGWRLKPLHRRLMLSDAYQQSHEVNAANLKLDPQNRYLWHFRPRRLEAEMIRDALLAVGGNLDPKMFGPSVLDDTRRRSVYLRVKRSELIPSMTMFDAPEPTQSIGERSVTTVPTQALAMMNSPFVRTQAEKLRDRIRPTADKPTAAQPTAVKAAAAKPTPEKPGAAKPSAAKPTGDKPIAGKPAAVKPGADKPAVEKPAVEKQAGDAWIAAAVDRGYAVALGRGPTTDERKQMIAFIEAQRATTPGAARGAAAASDKALDGALVEFCQVLLSLNEFVYVD
jgi:hypothetical protein